MIELNLLPDIKLDYIKTQRTRRLVFTVSVLVTAAAVALLVLLLGVDGLQKKHLSDLNRDITSETSKLKGEPNINQILTVQNQLNSLTKLHASKPAASRTFDYLAAVTPATVSINNFSIDFTKNTINIAGGADALSSINQYVDTLKYTTYTSNNNKNGSPAFSNVVLSSFGLSGGQDKSQAASYTITLAYDKSIFDITQEVKLTVPSVVTTRSGVQQPTDLFKSAPAPVSNGGGSSHG